MLGVGGALDISRPVEFAFVFYLASRYAKVHVNDLVACDDTCFEAAFNKLCFDPSTSRPGPGSFCATHPTYPDGRIDTAWMGQDATKLDIERLENVDLFVIAPNGSLANELGSIANRALGPGSTLYAAFLPKDSGAMAVFGMDAIEHSMDVEIAYHGVSPTGYYEISGAFRFPYWELDTDPDGEPIRIFSPLFYDDNSILTGVLEDPARFPTVLVVRPTAP